MAHGLLFFAFLFLFVFNIKLETPMQVLGCPEF